MDINVYQLLLYSTNLGHGIRYWVYTVARLCKCIFRYLPLQTRV